MLSSDIERANCYNIRNRISIQAFEKGHNVSYRTLNSTVKTRRVYTESITYVTKFSWKM